MHPNPPQRPCRDSHERPLSHFEQPKSIQIGKIVIVSTAVVVNMPIMIEEGPAKSRRIA